MAPMWRVVPPRVWYDPPQLLASGAESSVQCLDDATSHLKCGRRESWWKRTFTVKRLWKWAPVTTSSLLLLSLLGFGAYMLITAQDQRTKCEREYYDCLAKEDAKAQATVQSGGIIDQSHLASCSTLAEIQSLSDGPDLACDTQFLVWLHGGGYCFWDSFGPRSWPQGLPPNWFRW